MRVPVHVIAGFLGTGKTTAVLDQLRRRPDERVAVLVNDFGDAAIDQALVDDAGQFAITEIRGACVCCTAPEGFTAALRALLDEQGAERIFIEPTGLARPADLIDTLRRGPDRDRIALQPVVVLVDPATFDPDAPLVGEQAEAGDVLVANRVDLASPDQLARFEAWAASRWPAPVGIYRTTQGRLPDGALGWPEGTGPRAPRAHDHDHHDKGLAVRTRVWSPDAVFDRDRLRAAFERLIQTPGMVRAKGLFRTLEGAWLVEVAGGRLHERPASYRRDSRVDVFAHTEASLDQAAAWLDAARCTPEERAHDLGRIEVVLPDGQRRRLDRDALRALPDSVPDIAPLIPKRRGAAARLRSVFDDLEVVDDPEVVVVAADGFATPPVPASALRTGLLLHSVDGEALPEALGGPFRLLIPGDAGPGGPCANVKGVVRIVLRAPAATAR